MMNTATVNQTAANPQTTLMLIEKLMKLPMDDQAHLLHYTLGVEAAQAVSEAKNESH